MAKEIAKKVVKSTDELAQVFHRCHNILRDQEGIVGMKALNIVGDLLFLKLLEPLIEKKEVNLSEGCKFSTFSNMPEEDMMEHLKKVVWKELWANDKTKSVYNGRAFEIKFPHTLKDIVVALDSVDFDHTSSDIKGAAYEHFISKELIGKTLGQFFTPRSVVNSMVEKLNPKIKKDGTSETVYDPACGTGGFLIQAFKHLKEQKGANLDWIRKNAIHGGEREPDTVRICKLNMMLAGDGSSTIVNRDSLMYCPEEMYDIVLANPPFGIKGIKFDKLGINYPIESNTAEFLFLENIVKVLKKGGRAAVVLPEGVLFKTGIGTKLREWFLQEVDLEQIVSLASGTFDYAGVKTSILYFTKPAIKPKGKFATKEIEFIDFGQVSGTKIKIKDIVKNEFILDLKTYTRDKIVNKSISKNSNAMKISDIFTIETGTFASGDMNNKGPYPFYSAKVNSPVGTHDEYSYDFPEYFVLIKSGGSKTNLYGENVGLAKAFYIKGKAAVTNHCWVLNPNKNTDKYIVKYLLYALKNIRKNICDLAKFTTGLGFISKKDFENLLIELPSIPEQQQYVEKMDFIHEKLNKSKVVVVENIQKEIEILVKSFRGQRVKLSDLVDIKGGRLESKYAKENGEYPFFVCGAEPLKIDKADYDQEAVLLAGTGEVYAFYYNGKFNARQKVHILTKKKEASVDISMKLLYYIINNNLDYFRDRQQGATMKNVDQENVMSFEFNLPEDPVKALEKLEQKTKIIELIQKDLMDKE